MKNIITIFICFFIFLSCTSFVKSNKASITDKKSMSTWLWRTEEIVKRPDEVLAFLVKEKVNLVHLQVNQDVSNEYYETFIRQAREKGIKVYALGGSPKWIQSKQKVSDFFKWIEQYQGKVEANSRFAGIHIDFEPYLLEEWNKKYKTTVYKYQKNIVTFKKQAKALKLPLDLAIPFWFDNRVYNNKKYGKGKLSEWVTQQVDEITIMAYRNNIDGSNSVLSLTKDEIQFANKFKNKRITIALETKELKNEEFLTFYGKGKITLNQAIEKIHHSLSPNKSYKGIAIHSFTYWEQMR